MKAVELYQKTVRERKAAIDATLNLRKNSTLDTATISATQLTRLAVKPSTPIQNSDGTFINMPGYDY